MKNIFENTISTLEYNIANALENENSENLNNDIINAGYIYLLL